ncbi:cytochrome P450 3A11 [Tetranychus urticae]|uniref:cytochrome P450 3A11 n=1 Tax=Tetranychus urticae TaxID=32264 RepID=UPI000D6527B4|nr:cytochrome P450 3A11 [Tetranychus urticae]
MLPLALADVIQSTKGLSIYFIGFLIFCLIYNRWKISYWYRNGIPGPKSIPFVGNALDLLFKPSFETELDYVRKYGKIVGIYHGCQPNLIIADPDLIKSITVKEFSCFPESFSFPYLSPIERKFLTVLYGNEWKRVRSLLSQTFTTGKLKKVFELIKSCMVSRLDDLRLSQDNLESSFIDVKHFWGRYNLDVTAKAFFGTDLNVYSQSKAQQVLYNFEQTFKTNPISMIINMVAPEWFNRLTRQSAFNTENLEYLEKLAEAVIEARKEHNPNHKYNDFLQLLLESEVNEDTNESNCEGKSVSNDINRQRLSTDEIVSSAVIFLIAGYETTSTLLSWTCYELTRNPDIQEKLYSEIDSLTDVNYETIPVILLPRVAHSDYQLPGKGSPVLPKGSKAFISIYALHHNPEYYPEPYVFQPERFLPENRSKIKPFTFLPFGSGPRLCIGMRFALINAKLALALFLKQYKLVDNVHTTKDIEHIFQFGVLAAKNLKVGIEKRN